MKEQHHTAEFIILGGGIAGLTAAIALKKEGIESTIIEASPQFKPVGAGIVLALNAIRVFKELNLYKDLLLQGNPLDQLCIFNHKGKLLSRTRTLSPDGESENIAIHRALLHDILLSHIDKSNILTGKRTAQVQIIPKGYRIVFEDGTSMNAKNLVVAEGINSVSRQQFFPDVEKRYSGYTCWRGIAEIKSLKLKEASETWGKNGRFGIVPLGNDKIYWFAVKNSVSDYRELQNYSNKDLFELFKSYHHPIGQIINATPVNQIIWNDIYDLKPFNHYSKGNMVLIGDAAHATTPNMGQGACQAIEDAMVLAKCLREKTMVEEAFRTFESKRLNKTHYVVNQSWKIGKVAQLENEVLIALRNTVFRALPDKFYRRQLEKIYNE